MPSKQIFLDQE